MTVTLDYPDVVALHCEIMTAWRRGQEDPAANAEWLSLVKELKDKLGQARADLHAAGQPFGKWLDGWPHYEMTIKMPHRNPDFVMTVPLLKPTPSLNTLMRQSGRWVKKEWTEKFRDDALEVLGGYSPKIRAKFPLAKAEAQIALYYCGTEPDNDNTAGTSKVLLDGLTLAGVWTDDRPSVLTLLPIKVERVAKKAERRVCVEVWNAEDMTHGQ